MSDSPVPAVVEVAVPAPFMHTLTYEVPARLRETLAPGHLVTVPLGRREVTGVVWNEATLTTPPAHDGALKPVTGLADPHPVFGRRLLRLLGWVSRYYAATPGDVFQVALPPGLMRLSRRCVVRGPKAEETTDLFGGLPTGIDSLLGVLPPGTELSLEEAMAKSGMSEALLKRHADNGVIDIIHRLQPPKVKPKYQRYAVLAVPEEQARQALEAMPKRAVRRRELLAVIIERTDIAVTELAALYGGAREAVNRLEKDGIIRIQQRRVLRAPMSLAESGISEPVVAALSAQQTTLLEQLTESIDGDAFAPFLVHGVTGSGKTEVYIRAARHAVERGRKTLVLVPEIALTPQLIRRFSRHFGDRVAVWHSSLSLGERLDEWSRIRSGQVDVVIGARSAVFVPLEPLGLIIVDEEHEGAYKSEDRVYYHARDVAVKRAQISGCVAVLGSATPSLESYYNAAQGRYRLLELTERVANRAMPGIQLITLSPRDLKDNYILSADMVHAIDTTLERREQVILFVPRRGFAPVLSCPACGWVLTCPHCSVSLSYHKKDQRFHCHYCDYTAPVPQSCDECGGDDILLMGQGTERVETLLHNYFPTARMARLDRDAMRRKGELEDILNSFARGDVDILVGTQMVTKGHDFPNVTLVGVVMADHSMNFPDFRALERTFLLLTQVGGRSGRGERAGSVVIQTMSPRHPLFTFVANHDYAQFARYELSRRRQGKYPPYFRLARIVFSGHDHAVVEESAGIFRQWLDDTRKRQGDARSLIILGPTPAPLEKLKDEYRYHIVVKTPHHAAMTALVKAVHTGDILARMPAGVSLRFDVDPQNML